MAGDFRGYWKAYANDLGLKTTQILVTSALTPGGGTLYKSIKEMSDVLPDPQFTPRLGWKDVANLMPSPGVGFTPIERDVVGVIMAAKNKKERELAFEGVYPFRTKSDRRQRRIRFEDLYQHAKRTKTTNILIDTLTTLKAGSDYIFTLFVIVARYVFGEEWWCRLSELKVFDGDLEHFMASAKELNTIRKVNEIKSADQNCYAELNVLTGLRNPPFPGFDPIAEAEALATGGLDFNLFGTPFAEYVKRSVVLQADKVEFMSFDDYIASGIWETAGSSSVGRYDVVIDGESFEVRCNKHTVLDVIDASELYQRAANLKGQENKFVIKPETGKLRGVVSGDLYTYLLGAYMIYLTGGAKYKIPGLTRGESFSAKVKRLKDMCDLCVTHYGLPFDYKSFDHQPTTSQIKTLVDYYFTCGLANVPPSYMSEWLRLKRLFVESFDYATLLARDGQTVREFRIEGGLMSGLPITSDIGDLWNLVMTNLCIETISGLGLPVDRIKRYICGDDSAIYVPNWATGALMNAGYGVIGVEGGIGKFSLQGHRPDEAPSRGVGGKMEFLRQWFTEDRIYGWPARALRGLVSDQPTSDTGWTTTRVISAMYESVKTLRRRLPERRVAIDSLWTSLRGTWCRNHNLPVDILRVPTSSGGAGLEPVAPGVVLTTNIDKINPAKLGFTFKGLNRRRAERVKNYAASRYGIVFSDTQADEIALEELRSTVLADSVHHVSSSVRRRWLDELKRQRVTVKTTFKPTEIATFRYSPLLLDADNYKQICDITRSSLLLFNTRPGLATVVRDYKRFRLKSGLKRFIQEFDPVSYSKLCMFHSSWHMSARIDYLTGEIPVQVDQLHPDLLGILKLFVAALHGPRNRYNDYCHLWHASVVEQLLIRSPLSQRYFQC